MATSKLLSGSNNIANIVDALVAQHFHARTACQLWSIFEETRQYIS